MKSVTLTYLSVTTEVLVHVLETTVVHVSIAEASSSVQVVVDEPLGFDVVNLVA